MSFSLRSVEAILILDNEGRRVVSKYYGNHFPAIQDQRDFEGKIHTMVDNSSAEIAALDGFTFVFTTNVDLIFIVVGLDTENELMLKSCLNTLYDAVSILLRHEVEYRSIMDQISSVYLIVDDLVDNGIIMECDGGALVASCAVGGASSNNEDISIAEQSLQQAFQSARNQLLTSFLK